MKAVMLAAGVGRRLYGDENDNLPKALLEFDGKTLLERHVRILLDNGVDELVLVVGHRKEDLLAQAMKPPRT
ncbi:MAG: NTP transferase domain-containing protein [Rhodospirillales bacterium]|nr:NTP transferase domain-containing protein [Rhodospirillales bacterium]